MQKITPHLWFNQEAKEAAEFYARTFGGDSRVMSSTVIKNTPSGATEMVTFQVRGHDFMAISAGPLFTFNPSISFTVNFDPSHNANAEEDIDRVWKELAMGGMVRMEIGEYPFSKRYGWVQDKYGISWQLILTNPQDEERPVIIPSLIFTGAQAGKAEEATAFYRSVFPHSRQGTVVRYGNDQKPEVEGSIMFSDFTLNDQWFSAMDSAADHQFSFNEAISFVISCDSQEEIDYYWEKLSAVPQAEQCGWLKDKYGVSWQVVPSAMEKFMSGSDDQRERVTKAFLAMKKFDIAALERAYNER